MEINTKYEMGQKVYRARVIKRTFDIEETCDLCCGEKKINYKGYSCMCPKCDGEGKIITGQKTKLSREIQKPREITSVKVSFSINGLSSMRTVSIDCFVAVLTNGQVILYTLFAKKDTLNILRHMHIRRLKSQGIL